MTTKSMAYDNAAYEAVSCVPFVTAAGSGAAGQKFCAFTALLLKSVTVRPTTAPGTSDVISLISISGTTTTTTAITTFGSGATAAVNASVNSIPLNQGDLFYVVNGTDTTAVLAGAIEYVIQPLANVTV